MSILTLGALIVIGIIAFSLFARAGDDRPAWAPPMGAGSASIAPKDVDPEIIELAHSGRKVEAIKAYRAEYGVGLREAKEAVDAL